MKSRPILTILIVAGAIWYFSRQAVRVDIGSPGISFLKLSGSGIQLNLKMPVLNRSDFTYTVQGFLGQILFNGSPLGTITLKQQVQLPARGMAAPEFVTEIGFGALAGPLAALLQQFTNITIPVLTSGTTAPASLSSLRIRGTLYVSGLAVDINEPLA